jgi:hypothetical protein
VCYKVIKLTKGKHTLVDVGDFEYLNQWKWHAYLIRGNWHISRCERGVTIKMSREIMGCVKGDGKIVDHINHDTFDNRRHNLRFVTSQQNHQNALPWGKKRSKFKGVCWHKGDGLWHSRITNNGKVFFLGAFTDEKEAATVYDKKAKKLFGEFACLNF